MKEIKKELKVIGINYYYHYFIDNNLWIGPCRTYFENNMEKSDICSFKEDAMHGVWARFDYEIENYFK